MRKLSFMMTVLIFFVWISTGFFHFSGKGSGSGHRIGMSIADGRFEIFSPDPFFENVFIKSKWSFVTIPHTFPDQNAVGAEADPVITIPFWLVFLIFILVGVMPWGRFRTVYSAPHHNFGK